MNPTTTVIPIDHRPRTHEIDMQASFSPQTSTLLELIAAVNDVSDSEQEALSTITYMLESGRVRFLNDSGAEPRTKLCG